MVFLFRMLLTVSTLFLSFADSPGFLKDDFLKYMFDTAERTANTAVLQSRGKFLRAHASSGHKRAIEELLGDADFRSQLADVRAADEVCTDTPMRGI